MKILLAFDKFKDAASAGQMVAAAETFFRDTHPHVTCRSLPLTDGGEGFARILTEASGGTLYPVTVPGPQGSPVRAEYGIVCLDSLPQAVRSLLNLPDTPGETLGVVEMATAAGLEQVSDRERNPWETTTYGLGRLLREAAPQASQGILLGIGGSATNDLGVGALAALGLHPTGEPPSGDMPPAWVRPRQWSDLPCSWEISHLVPLPRLWVACDVDNPLLGPSGATAVFGPQKGLPLADQSLMEERIARMATLLEKTFARPSTEREAPGAGAAGGVSYGLGLAYPLARLPGAEIVQSWQDWETHLDWADIILTGEGRVDQGFFHGKGPGALARAAQAKGKPVRVLAGAITWTSPKPPAAVGSDISFHALTPPDMPLSEALPRTPQLLREALAQLSWSS